jgi:hypothetical protein
MQLKLQEFLTAVANGEDVPATSNLTVTQLQKLLVLWLLMSANTTDLDQTFLINQWDQDIAPHVTDIPNAKAIFFPFAAGPGVSARLQTCSLELNAFTQAGGDEWDGDGGCIFTYNTILGMFPS